MLGAKISDEAVATSTSAPARNHRPQTCLATRASAHSANFLLDPTALVCLTPTVKSLL
jgi:hypothetical protein